MPRSRINGNFINKTSSIVANILLRIIPTNSGEKEAFTYYRDGGDSEIAKAWSDQAVEYWKQAIALTPSIFVCIVRKEEDSMIIRSPEPEVKILEWARPGHFSRTIAKVPNTTTWIWNLHVDAHDFNSHTSYLEEISRKVFSAHFSQLSIIFFWPSGMYFQGAHLSNYEAWLSDPTHIRPSAQVVWPIIWRASGRTSELQLYCTVIGALVFATLMLSSDVESMLNHHLAGLLGLGSLSWARHQIHVSLPINQFLDAGVDPKEIPLPHEFILNRDILAQLYPSFVEGETPFFTLNWSKYAKFLTFRGGLDPVTGGLWLTDIGHHHLAIAILFLISGHMYRTNWRIGHGLKDILEAHKGPFTGQGHKGIYEILTTSWHAQLSLNLVMLGSLTIVVAHHMYAMPPYPYLTTDYGTILSLFIHHMWIDRFLIVGVTAHAAIFMVRDYDPITRYNDLLDHVLRHRNAIISHLNLECIFLCFHSFGLYIHNDTMSISQFNYNPSLLNGLQNTHILTPGTTAPGAKTNTSLTWGGGVFYLLLVPVSYLIMQIWVFCFPCDGPGKGGTCQICLENAIRYIWGSINDQGVLTHITGRGGLCKNIYFSTLPKLYNKISIKAKQLTILLSILLGYPPKSA
ncbi:hypothetical protein MKX03_003693 [Papaver bracteatum]|nr:hypothetical protein MKX03_003693 [Papaver bracteatum]